MANERGVSTGLFGFFYPNIDGHGSVSNGFVKMLSEETGTVPVIECSLPGRHVLFFWKAYDVVLNPLGGARLPGLTLVHIGPPGQPESNPERRLAVTLTGSIWQEPASEDAP